MTETINPVADYPALNVDIIGTAETASQAHRDATYAHGYLQALFDTEQIQQADYDQHRATIQEALKSRLSFLRAVPVNTEPGR
ncbi:hypothetical protein [Pseudomonas sp. PNPG3]|uniref:hypothetical protein n=1 Tax=Pseudomonas sp. PNPG3 TaxID=2919497 RepID=UPI001FFD1D86|nr:hypothetical protein [Pseudomonas sp. PNPG3]MCK2122171.1 hypothetical protein [Pseudomonas sp. PNPG3]